ncbi:hypothetical protein TNCV_2421301 [Trichonephila clavipes]|nr:hypothetical protein TNCV_2421301 [Trichonephila clavipes]
MSSVGYSSSPVHCSRWSPSILAWPQSGQASGGILPKSHTLWLGKSGQQVRLFPGASGLDLQRSGSPMAFQGSWSFGSRDSKCVGGELKAK